MPKLKNANAKFGYIFKKCDHHFLHFLCFKNQASLNVGIELRGIERINTSSVRPLEWTFKEKWSWFSINTQSSAKENKLYRGS